MGLPARIALPILAVFAVAFLALMGYFLRIGLGTTGSAFGPGAGVSAQRADTPAPIATDPPGTFTVPQTGTGPIAAGATTLPGASTGGGNAAGGAPGTTDDATALRARLVRNPNDLAALVAVARVETGAQRFERADAAYRRALALDPANPDVRTDDALVLHRAGRDLPALAQLDRVLAARPGFGPALFTRAVVLEAIGRTTEAGAAYRRALAHLSPHDPRAAAARTALQRLAP